jgi:hypothetical protein
MYSKRQIEQWLVEVQSILEYSKGGGTAFFLSTLPYSRVLFASLTLPVSTHTETNPYLSSEEVEVWLTV